MIVNYNIFSMEMNLRYVYGTDQLDGKTNWTEIAYILNDKATGCEYIILHFTGYASSGLQITPRLGTNGKPLCYRGTNSKNNEDNKKSEEEKNEK